MSTLTETETNDTFEAANELPFDTELQGQLVDQYDIDSYRIEILTPTVLTINVGLPEDNPYRQYALISLYGENNYLINNYRFTDGTEFKTGIDEAGSYYLQLYSFGELSYTLEVNQDGATSSYESEDNDTMELADELVLGASRAGSLGGSSAPDFYRVELTEAGVLHLHMALPDEFSYRNNFSVNVYTEQEELIYQQETGKSQDFYVGVADAGNYFVEITHNSSESLSDAESYTLSADHITDFATAIEVEENDTDLSAQLLASGTSIRGNLMDNQDTDVYQIDVSSPSTLMIDMELLVFDQRSKKSSAELYDADGELVGVLSMARYQGLSTDRFYGMDENVEQGTYFLHVGGFAWRDPVGLDYLLTVNEIPLEDQAAIGSVIVDGDAQVGSTLSANVTLENPDDAGELSYQWYDEYGDIEGATDSIYVIRDFQDGVSVKVSYTDSLGNVETIFSDEVVGITRYTEVINEVISGGSYDYLIQAAYVAYYGRPADPGGLTAWSDQLEQADGDLSSIMQAFGSSAEYENRYGNLSNEALIEEIYYQLLGRDSNDDEVSAWAALLQSGTKSLQTIVLDILLGARNMDALAVLKKIEFAEYFTELVTTVGQSYQGVEQANAIAEVMGKVGAETNAEEFDDLLADYNLMIDGQEHYYFVDLESIVPTSALGALDSVVESILPTSFELSLDQTRDELGMLEVEFNVGTDIKALLSNIDDDTLSKELTYVLGFDIDDDEVDDIAVTFSASAELFSFDDQGELYTDDNYPLQLVDVGYYDEFSREINDINSEYDFDGNFVASSHHSVYPVVEFNFTASILLFGLDLNQTLPDPNTVSEHPLELKQMISNAEYLLPETLNSFSVTYLEQQVDLDAEAVSILHEGQLEYQFSTGDILFV